ncbi:MAG: hypothetical protein IPK16_14380 [Anaerolineales bacterium]|nr:hypothetical protein [Anaerolineales bacterium]
MTALTQALRLAAPGGYVRLFVDEGEPMRDLIHEWAVTNTSPHSLPYVDSLLAAFDQVFPPMLEVINSPTDLLFPILVEPLTERELEVLRLVAAGSSNAEIAEQLVLTVGTVKTHLKHIYAKLTVQSRTQAIAQARRLGLL